MWQSFSIVFGLTGLVLNARWVNVGPPPVSSLLWTVPVSTVSALAVMALLARILRPILSSKETEATKRSALVGQVGTVISSRVTTEFGEIRLNDRTGQVVRVVCKLEKGSRVPHEHEQVVVVACEDGVLYVAPLDADGPPSKPRVAEPLEDPPPEEAEERRRAAP
jgi:membrane protein implicated in regulation of membrane protease activity